MATFKHLLWDIYNIHATKAEIHGVMLRGRIRKFGLEHGINILCENATDEEKCVRFALQHQHDPRPIIDYIQKIIPDAEVELALKNVPNPVLSKLKVNKEERYSL